MGSSPRDSGWSEDDDSVDTLPDEIRQIVEDDSDDPNLSLDEIFELLKNERRREVIHYLLSAENNTTTLSDLAEHIAAKENDIDITQLSSDQRKRVYIGLYQCHLPKMDEMGVIDFDNNRGDVELNGAVDQVMPYLTRDGAASDQASPTIELGVALGVVALLLATVLSIGPASGMTPLGVAAISTVALIGIALYQVAKEH